jgi:hypothetical protein
VTPVGMDKKAAVCQLSKCDGSPSNVAIALGGKKRGSILHRQDGPKNCCPILLRYICLGVGENPTFPHAQHVLAFDFLGDKMAVERTNPDEATAPPEAKI